MSDIRAVANSATLRVEHTETAALLQRAETLTSLSVAEIKALYTGKYQVFKFNDFLKHLNATYAAGGSLEI